MDHMNVFLPFENKPLGHEDTLTRNFLFLIKAAPAVRRCFGDLILKNTKSQDPSAFEKVPDKISIKSAYTQVDYRNPLFETLGNGIVLSLLISDDAFEGKHRVEYSDREARYDGVLTCDSDFWIIIENKPFVGNVWNEQLNLNLQGRGKKENLIREPCTLSWRQIVSMLKELLAGCPLHETERVLIVDFLMYVNEAYVWLNPFDRLDLCQNDTSLINRRCCAILESIGKRQTEYHKGWGWYISTNNPMIKMISLCCEQLSDTWEIKLRMNFGVTQSSANSLYQNINVNRFAKLLLEERNITAVGAFHYAMRSDNIYTQHRFSMPSQKYVEYWKEQKGRNLIHQINRSSFIEFNEALINDGILSEESRGSFNEKVMAKRYSTLNVCPELQIVCTWKKDEALHLDSQEDKFSNDVANKIREVMRMFDGDKDIGF